MSSSSEEKQENTKRALPTFFSDEEFQELSDLCLDMLKNPELIHEYARKRVVMQMLMLGMIPGKVRGMNAARDITAAIAKEQELLAAALALKDEDGEEEHGRGPDAKGDEKTTEGRDKQDSGGGDTPDIGALLENARQLLDGGRPVQRNPDMANPRRTRRKKSVQRTSGQDVHPEVPGLDAE